jgi:hypothetical protein
LALPVQAERQPQRVAEAALPDVRAALLLPERLVAQAAQLALPASLPRAAQSWAAQEVPEQKAQRPDLAALAARPERQVSQQPEAQSWASAEPAVQRAALAAALPQLPSSA